MHSNKEKLKCMSCENEYFSEDGLKQHVLSKHEGKKYLCRHCTFQSSHRSAIRIHEKNQHE